MILQNPTIAFIVFVGFFVLILYSFLVWFIGRKLISIKPDISEDVELLIFEYPFISVVVAFRNEANNLDSLIQSLANQTYPSDRFEIIVVNDHSTDHWHDVLKNLPSNVTLIEADGEGKKAAIKTGVIHAKASIIACTDADCILPDKWLLEIGKKTQSHNVDMIIGLVDMTSDESFLSYFQQLDFRSLQLVGFGCALSGRPIMCNGANIVFRKEAYLKHQQLVKEQYLSGDDMFLLHALKHAKAPIGVLTSTNSIVRTRTEKSWSAFMKQRIRWASKSKGYTDFETIGVALLVLFANISVIALLVCSFYGLIYFVLFVVAFAFKSVVERMLFKRGIWLSQTIWQETRFWMMQLIHPFYIVMVALSSFFYTVKWKDRPVFKS